MIGCAALIKPLYLAFLILPRADPGTAPVRRRRTAPKGWIPAAAMIGMALAPLTLAVAWFAWQGALGDMIDVHLLFNWNVYSSGAPVRHWDAVRRTVKFFLSDPVVFGLPVIVAGACLWRNSRSSARMILMWAIVAVMCVAAQRRFFKYHWVVVFPAVLATGSGGFDLLVFAFGKAAEWRARSARLLSQMALALATIAVLRLGLFRRSGVVQWMKLATGRVSLDQYYASHMAGSYMAGDDLKAAAYIWGEPARLTPWPCSGITPALIS